MKSQSANDVHMPLIFSAGSFLVTAFMLALSIAAVAGKPEVFQVLSIERALYTLLVISLACLLCRKWLRKDLCIFIIPVLFSIWSGHSLALFGWLLFSISSFILGSFIVNRFPSAAVASLGSTLPFMQFCVGLAFNSFLTWIAMHFPINVGPLYWVLYAAEAILLSFSPKRARVRVPRSLSAGQWVVVAHFLLFLPFALVPSYNFDDLAVHLFIPHQTSLFEEFSFSTEFVGGFNPSMIPMGAYTSAFMLGGENAVRLVNLSMYSIGFLLLEALTRQLWGNRSAALAVLFACTVPFTEWTLGICFVDSFFFLFSTLLLATATMLLRSRDVSLLPWLGLVVGLGYLVKQQTIFLAIPLSAPILLLLVPQLVASPRRVLILLGVATCAFLGSIAAPLAYNFVITGNPLFPFYNSIFHSPFWPGPDLVDSRWSQPFALRTLWNITFHGSRFIENSEFSFGFTLLVLSPAILLVGSFRYWKGQKDVAALFLLLIAYAFLTYSTTGLYMRYLTGGIAVMALLAALTTNSMLLQSSAIRWLTSIVVTILLMGNAAALVSGRNLAEPYPIVEALTGSLEHSTMSYHSNFKKLFRRGAEICGRDSLGLLIDAPANYLAETRIVSNYWHFPMVSSKLAAATNPSDLNKLVFEEMSVCYFIMPLTQAEGGVNGSEFRSQLQQVDRTVDYGLFIPIQR